MKPVAVVTGGSSGIGRAAVHALAKRGYTVYELSRSGASDEAVHHITADVTQEEQVRAALGEVFSREGRLDLLVNNAGMGISGAVEYTTLADARRIFDVNFFGAFLCARESLPYLRQSPEAQIINVSSVAAVFAIPYQAFYSATKAALSSLTLALASELRPFGIRVNGILPGDVSTGFTGARVKSERGAEVYGAAIERAVGVMEKDEENGMAPERIAEAIYAVARGRASGRLYTVGVKYKLFVLLGKLLPTGFANSIVAEMYK